jgi:hypothetical protein
MDLRKNPELAADYTHLAPELDEEDRVARVLAEGDAPFAGHFRVLQQPLEGLAA